MFRLLKFFLIFILGYHVLQTYTIFGLELISYINIIKLSKEIFWFIFIFILIIINFKIFLKYIIYYKKIILVVILLIIRALLISQFNHKSISDIIFGFKYDILYILILLSAVFIGYLLKFKFQIHENEIYKYFQDIYFGLILVLIIGLIWQITKICFSDLYYHIGYGPVGDYIENQSPPIYYRTGAGGMTRLSGIFAGPNNYSYLLVLFGLFLLIYKIKIFFIRIVVWILYSISLIWAISRSAYISIFIQGLVYFNRNISKLNKLLLLSIGLIFFLFLLLFKYDSTIGHFLSGIQAFNFFIGNPWGAGLGTVGLNKMVLSENIYLQILIDTGIIGFICWIFFWILIFQQAFRIIKKDKNKKNKKLIYIFNLLTIGLLGLFVQGFFLHVLEDSMVNYIFFINYGLLWGYLNTTNYS